MQCAAAPSAADILAALVEAEPVAVADMSEVERRAALLAHLCHMQVRFWCSARPLDQGRGHCHAFNSLLSGFSEPDNTKWPLGKWEHSAGLAVLPPRAAHHMYMLCQSPVNCWAAPN